MGNPTLNRRNGVSPGRCPWTLADRPDATSLLPRAEAIFARIGAAVCDRSSGPALWPGSDSTSSGRLEFRAAEGES
jgi:hypothetical protein